MAIAESSVAPDFYGQLEGTNPQIQSWVASELESQTAGQTTIRYTFGFSVTGKGFSGDTQNFDAWANGELVYNYNLSNYCSAGKYRYCQISKTYSRPAYGASAKTVDGRARISELNVGDGISDTDTRNCDTKIPAQSGSTLGPPRNVAGVAKSPYSLNWEWDAPSNSGTVGPPAKNYMLQLSTDSNFASAVYSKEVGNVLWANVQNLQRGTRYYARVKAENNVGWGSWSSISPVYSTEHTAPDSPAAPTLSSPTTTGLTVKWVKPAYAGSGITSYSVQVSKDNFATAEKTVTGIAGTATSYAMTGLKSGVMYTARVQAIAVSGNSLWSAQSAPLQTTGGVKFWTGSAWANGIVYEWTGTAWKPALVKKWNGSAWYS